jgi:tricorn protease-like protein
MYWSPDNKSSWADKLRLQYVDIDTRMSRWSRGTAGEFTDYAWSPDGKWITYAKPEEKRMNTISSVRGRQTIK